MERNIYPTILRLSEFESLGFYDWLSSRACIFRSASANLQLSHPLPDEAPTKAKLVGDFYHDIMEASFRAKDESEFRLVVGNLLADYQAEVDKWVRFRRSGAFSGWIEVSNAINQARAKFTLKSSDGHTPLTAERSISAFEGKLKGRPDYFGVDQSVARIIELKSVSIRDENEELKEEFREQTLFYSVILRDKFGVNSVKVSVRSSNGDSEEFNISSEEMVVATKRILDDLASINQKIRRAESILELQTPGIHCLHCSKQPICMAFKTKQFSSQFSFPTFVIEGRVAKSSVMEISRTSRFSMDEVPVLGSAEIEVDAPINIQTGEKVTFTGLKKDTANQFSLTELSRVLIWTAQK